MKISNLYRSPKVRGSKEIQNRIKGKNTSYIEAPKLTDLKLRSIVGDPGSNPQRLNKLLDIILKPPCKIVPSYIEDYAEFFNYILQKIYQGIIFVRFHITSSYTNIPQDLGIEAVDFCIIKHPNSISKRFSKECTLEELKLILEDKHPHFDYELHLQIKGTAVGTNVTLSYVTLVTLPPTLINIGNVPLTIVLSFRIEAKKIFKHSIPS